MDNSFAHAMATSSDTVVRLRQLLADRFGSTALPSDETFVTGLAVLDETGVPRSALTEIVSSAVSRPGGSLLLYGLLHSAIKRGERIILIDGKGAFRPKGLPQADLNRLLWMRCNEAAEAIKAADLAVRDGNLPLIILLLTLNPLRELRRIPATAWHRLQMLAEKSATTLLVFTPDSQIGCARLRLSVSGSFPLDRLHVCRDELLPSLQVQVERRRMGEGRRSSEELRRSACA
jgi:hypothetical protein